jgi:hypothetical protein
MKSITKVVCDTNIWYKIGNGLVPIPGEEFVLVGTFLTTLEFSKTKNLIKNIEFVRRGIQAIMKYAKYSMNHVPPLIHVKKLLDPKYCFLISPNYKSTLEFLRKIAIGHDIAEDMATSFELEMDEEKNGLHEVAQFLNSFAVEIKKRIKNKVKHKNEDVTIENRKLIADFVSRSIGQEETLEAFDWSRIELFEAVLNLAFKKAELGAMKFVANDFTDLFMLLYVQPGMQYWTDDGKWLEIINEAGMGHYLFRNSHKA